MREYYISGLILIKITLRMTTIKKKKETQHNI